MMGTSNRIPLWILLVILSPIHAQLQYGDYPVEEETYDYNVDETVSSQQHQKQQQQQQPQHTVLTGAPRISIIKVGTNLPVKALNVAHNNRVCSTWGNFHFKNFDGDIFYFPGTCNYVLASHCKSTYEEFNIQMRRTVVDNVPSIEKITMKLDGLVVETDRKTVLVNGEKVQLPFSGSGVQIEEHGVYLTVTSKLGMVFMWNDDDSLLLELESKYANTTCGLCGDFNGISIHNEFIANGIQMTAAQFGNLQKLDGPTELCHDVPPTPKSNCTDYEKICETVLLSSTFKSCHPLVAVEKYIETCVEDLCRCEGKDVALCLCDTFAEYSRQCAHSGGHPENWRTKDLCPKSCPFNMVYQECGSPCPDTCSNPEREVLCENHCMEGCFCPPGTVFDDINYSGCVPLETCSCTFNSNAYAAGTSYATPCSACTCSGGKWDCKNLPCPASCSIEGGSHITTYDQTHYSIHGDCNYVLSKACDGESFIVLAEMRKCGLTESETCLKSTTIILNGGETIIVIKPCGSVFVNSIYTQLPMSAANVTIFKPSSFYIIVHTNLGVQIVAQLTPFMQVYVALNPSYKTKTCGLCGNFNDKQSDDFQTTSGVIEGNAASFANTWKTQGTCSNVKNVYEDPCSLSVENEKYAQHWCGLITDPTGPFASCHATVNPGVYKQNCMFDTCNCEKSEDCMCASLSSYVRACATKGIILTEWRNSVCNKYMHNCPKSLNYTYSTSTCQPTCRSLSEPDVTCSIKFVPVDGCTCAKGFYMDDSGKCVPAALCPCYYKGSAVPSGEVVHDNGIMCTCTQGKLSCIGNIEPACKSPMVYFDCKNSTVGTKGSECQKSCQTLDMACYSAKCVSGCVCPDDLVADGKGGCIKEDDCPCVHNDATYQPGEKIKMKCNTCTCKDRMWQCTNNPCLATCAVYGDGHYMTFDGKRYSFNGDCEYILAQDHCGQAENSSTFRVITENIPCGTTGTTCSKSIKVFMGNYELVLTEEHIEVVERGIGGVLPYKVRHMGIYLVIEADNGLILMWDKKTSIFIKLSKDFEGKVCGLCGNYDGDGNNDFTTRSKSVVGDVAEFGNSWKISQSCPDANVPKDSCTANPYRKSWAQKQCSIINSHVFSACHDQVDSSKYYDACVADACACDSGGDCECFCTAVAAYAQACGESGICVAWRTPSICPLFCDYYNPEGECEWHYKPCGSNCLKTCRNPTGKCLHELAGLEGCYPSCPDDKPFFDEDEMECIAQCGCYDDDGNHFRVGQTVPSSENCQTCVCSKSGVECKFQKEACHCEYQGKMYHYNDVIYNTTDGIGGCISAICKENGKIYRDNIPCSTPLTTTAFIFTTTHPASGTTISKTTEICVKEECKWSGWIDASYPEFGMQNGDFDTYENIKAKGISICSHPKGIECRATRFPNTPLSELEQNVQCNVSFGLICWNKDQLPPICYDYEIRVKCCSFVPCSTTSSTTPPETSKPTTPHPTTKTTPPTTSQSTTETTTLTTTSTTEKTTHSTTASATTPEIISTPSTTTESATTSPVCQPKCTWTPWIDVHIPGVGKNEGDFETYQKIRASGHKLCKKPDGIQCRAEKYPEVPIGRIGQVVQCNVTFGLVCHNEEQDEDVKICLNYQIKVLCCDDYSNCQTTLPTTAETTTTTKPTTTETTTSITTETTTTPTTTSTTTETTTTPTTTSTTTETTTTPTTTSTTTETTTTPTTTSTTTETTTTPTTTSTTTETTTTPTTTSTTTETTTTPTTTSTTTETITTPTTTSTTTETTTTPTTTSTTTETTTTPTTTSTTTETTTTPTTTSTTTETTTTPTTTSTTTETTTTPTTTSTTTETTTTPTTTSTTTETTTTPTTTSTTTETSTTPTTTSTTTETTTTPTTTSTTTETTTTPTTTSTTTETTTTPTTTSTTTKTTTTPTTTSTTTETTTTPTTTSTTTETTTTPTTTSTTKTTTTPTTTSTTTPTTTSTTTPTTTEITTVPTTTETTTSTTAVTTTVPTTTETTATPTIIIKTVTTSKPSTVPLKLTTTIATKTTTPITKSTSCQPQCKWTPWIDVDTPTSGLDGGDRETFTNIMAKGKHFCKYPQHIECRASDYPGISIDNVGQIVKCDITVGLVCNNKDQIGNVKQCYNYQIKVLCCDDYSHCSTTPAPTTTETITTEPTTTKLTTTPKPTTTETTHTPTVTTTTETTTASCQPQCKWTSWIDVDTPSSGIDGGDKETYKNIMAKGKHICKKPQKIECRAKEFPDTSIQNVGQVVTCDVDVGLVCNNKDQIGSVKECYNYQIKVLCCDDYSHCGTTTQVISTTTKSTTTKTTTPTTVPTTLELTTTPKPPTTTETTPTTTVTTTPEPTTTSKPTTTEPTPTPTVTTTTKTTTASCQPQCKWTSWIDVDTPSSGIDGGDKETYKNIMAKGKHICKKPQKIECRAKEFPDTSIQNVGQVVTCDVDVGLVCNNKDQIGSVKECYNYQIKVLCCDDYSHCGTTTQVISTTTKSTTTKTTTPTTVPTTLELTTTPKPPTTTETTPTTTVTTTPEPTTTSKPTTTEPTPTPTVTTTTETTTASCQPQCKWTSWIDVDTPSSGIDGGDKETYKNIMAKGKHICKKPQKIECRAEEFPDTSIQNVGQVVTCDVDVGLVCNNKDQIGSVKECYNYQIKVLCCDDYSHCGTTTQVISTTTKSTTTKTTTPTTVPTTLELTTTPKPPTTTETTPTTTVTTTPEPTTTSKPTTTEPTPTPTVTTTTETTTASCQPQCKWTSWIDVDTPSSGIDGGDKETYKNIMAKGKHICKKPQKIECRAEEFPDTSIQNVGQVVKCDVDIGLVCNNKDQIGSVKECYNYQIKVLCCDDYSHCGTTTQVISTTSKSTTTKTTTPTTVPTTPEPTTTSISTTTTQTTPPETTPPSTTITTHCFCHVDNKFFSPGEIIYNKTDEAGCTFFAVCNDDCEADRFTGHCTTTTTPESTVTQVTHSKTTCKKTTSTPTDTTTSPTTTPTTTITTIIKTTQVEGCPPRKTNETWINDKCEQVTCHGNNVTTHRPVTCPVIEPITCDNGFPPVKKMSADGCCEYYECQCVCSGWGDPHYITFDGVYYTFLDNCTYVLVQQITPKYDNFRVLVDNYFCGAEDGLSCPQSILIYYKSNEVVLTRMLYEGRMKNRIRFNNDWVTPGFTKDGISVTSAGINMIVEIKEIDVFVSFSGLIFVIKLPFSKFSYNTEGQCGTCSNNKTEECRMPNGKIVKDCSAMAPHWRVNTTTPGCNNPPPVTPTQITPTTTPICPSTRLCDYILSDIFSECHKIIPPKPYHEGCVYDACHIGQPSIECASLEIYASLCTANGVCIDWREKTKGLCPYNCTAGKVYKPCGPVHVNTCDNKHAESTSTVRTEGCFCPEGKTLFNSYTDTCVESCACVGPDGMPKAPSETWTSQCNTCVCEPNSLTVQCNPISCPKLTPITCNRTEGFIPVTRPDPQQPCCMKTECDCNSTYCVHKERPCQIGFEAVPVFAEGDCCPKYDCIPMRVCVSHDVIYEPGNKIPQAPDSCHDCVCSNETDTSTSLLMVKCEHIFCNKDCDKGFKYVEDEHHCCGHCVQHECVMKMKNDEVKTYPPGETWTLPDDNCTHYQCVQNDDHFNTQTTSKECTFSSEKDCALGYKYEKTEGECCGTCVQVSCIIKLKDNTTQIMQPGETWNSPDQKCVKYKCEVVDGHFIQIEVTGPCPIEDCPTGYKLEKKPGECCGQCVKVFCVMQMPDYTTKILEPGQVYAPQEDKCTSYKCTDILEIKEIKQSCLVSSPADCLEGYKYEKTEEECCGHCVQVACIMKLKDNATKILPAGETWSPPDQPCTKYKCDVTENHFIPKEVTGPCPTEDCPVGYKLEKIPGDCCGHCVKVACVMSMPDNSTKIFEPEQVYTPPEDKCISYKCTKTLEMKEMEKSCLVVSPKDCLEGYIYEKTEEECCGYCKQVACIMKLKNNDTKLLQPGETWIPSDQPCTKYKCDGTESNFIPKEITGPCPIEDCPMGHKLEKTPGECCGQCVKVACVIQMPDNSTKILEKGQVYMPSDDNCTSYRCTDTLETKEIKKSCLVLSPKDCLEGYKYEKTEEECCGHCVQVACIMQLKDNTTKILQRGETWSPPDQPCTKYKCDVTENHFIPKEVTGPCPIEECPTGYKLEKTPGECCGLCVKVACVMKMPDDSIKILEPGKKYSPSDDNCTLYQCTDTLEMKEIKSSCLVSSPADCLEGYKYEKTEEECCGHCVQVACVMKLKDNTTKILQPKQTWSPPDQPCTKYRCDATENNFIPIEVTGPCSTEECPTGYKLEKKPGECCGQCVKVACVMQMHDDSTKILQPGENYTEPEDKCTLYECTKTLEMKEIKKACLVQSPKDCLEGYKYEKTEEECCGHCVQVACIMKLKDNATKILQPGEIWSPPDQPCTKYKCDVTESHFIPTEVTGPCPTEDCPTGYKLEKTPGECCGHCVKVACVMKMPDDSIKILEPGKEYSPSEDNCTLYKCSDTLEMKEIKSSCLVSSPADCLEGYKYEKTEEECCGHCVQVACIMKQKDNTTKILPPGETWSPPDQPCTKYKCDVTESHFITTEVTGPCPIEDCPIGYKLEKTPGECCGHCVKVACVMNMPDGSPKILEPGQVYTQSDDNCTSYQCTDTLEMKETKKSCLVSSPADCLEGYKYEKTEDECCGQCIQVACIMKLKENATKILQPGETWSPPDQPCTKFKCDVTESHFIPKEITGPCSIEDCPVGYKLEKKAGECCGQCVKVSCVMTMPDNSPKILQPGEKYTPPEDNCTTHECTDTLEMKEIKKPCLVLSPKDCLEGYKYEKTEEECCGTCVQVACIMKMKDNTTKILKPGETWSSPDQPCIKHECDAIEDQFVPTEVRRACPVEDCPLGYKYETTPGECCGQCVKVSCVMTMPDNSSKILQPGEVYSPPEDKCSKFECTKTLDVKEVTRTCPAFNPKLCLEGSIRTTEDGCCKMCNESLSGCQTHKQSRQIKSGVCQSDEVVELSYCGGACMTSSMYSAESNTMEHKCSCCQEVKTSKRTVNLKCHDGTSKVYTYLYAEECGCNATECDKDTQTSISQEEQHMASQEQQQKQQQQQKFN